MPSYWDSQGNVVNGRYEIVRGSKTIQTHNAVSVPLSGSSFGSNTWIDCIGFSDVAVTLLIDASVSTSLNLYWSNDGVTIQGSESLWANATAGSKAGQTGTKARYLKVQALNNDASAAHTMSAWVYLKT